MSSLGTETRLRNSAVRALVALRLSESRSEEIEGAIFELGDKKCGPIYRVAIQGFNKWLRESAESDNRLAEIEANGINDIISKYWDATEKKWSFGGVATGDNRTQSLTGRTPGRDSKINGITSKMPISGRPPMSRTMNKVNVTNTLTSVEKDVTSDEHDIGSSRVDPKHIMESTDSSKNKFASPNDSIDQTETFDMLATNTVFVDKVDMDADQTDATPVIGSKTLSLSDTNTATSVTTEFSGSDWTNKSSTGSSKLHDPLQNSPSFSTLLPNNMDSSPKTTVRSFTASTATPSTSQSSKTITSDHPQSKDNETNKTKLTGHQPKNSNEFVLMYFMESYKRTRQLLNQSQKEATALSNKLERSKGSTETLNSVIGRLDDLTEVVEYQSKALENFMNVTQNALSNHMLKINEQVSAMTNQYAQLSTLLSNKAVVIVDEQTS